MTDKSVTALERIDRTIRRVRGHNVMLDADLAALYGVETRELVQAVTRNADRFPADFMFQLTLQEAKVLRSQIVISKTGAADDERDPMPSLSKGWPCCPACCAVGVQCE